MADVYLSYSHADRDAADRLATILKRMGFTVWRDVTQLSSPGLDSEIPRQLSVASAVVVLWSAHSVHSEWVRHEAAFAKAQGTFLPVLLECIDLPPELRHDETVNL